MTNDYRPVPFEQLTAKGNDFSVYMTWRGIITAIKSKYKEPKHLAKENFSENGNQEKVSLCSLCKNKRICRQFVRRKSERRATIPKLKDELNISDHEMEKVLLLPFKVSTDVKCRDFQYTQNYAHFAMKT